MLIGLKKMFKDVASLLYTYTTSGTPGVQGGSYYTTYVGSKGPGAVIVSQGNPSQSLYSKDLINWTQTDTKIVPYNKDTFAYGSGIFLITNNSGDVSYSEDGVNWTTSSAPQGYNSLVYGNNIFVGFGNSGAVGYTPNGSIWYSANSGLNQEPVAAFGNNKYVAVDYYGATAYASVDGLNSWTLGDDLSNFAPAKVWKSIQFGNNKFVAITGSGESAYSTDGQNWTQGDNLGNYYWTNLTYGNGTFVALGFNSQIAYSTNGINWTLGELLGGVAQEIGFINNKFVRLDFMGSIKTSSDGITWSSSIDLPKQYGGAIVGGEVSTLQEVQTVIGGQGSEGSYVESLLPVKLYEPNTKITLNKIIATNTSNTTQYFDVYVKRTSDNELELIADDVPVYANSTKKTSINNIVGPSETYKSVYVSATAANVLTFKVY